MGGSPAGSGFCGSAAAAAARTGNELLAAVLLEVPFGLNKLSGESEQNQKELE